MRKKIIFVKNKTIVAISKYRPEQNDNTCMKYSLKTSEKKKKIDDEYSFKEKRKEKKKCFTFH